MKTTHYFAVLALVALPLAVGCVTPKLNSTISNSPLAKSLKKLPFADDGEPEIGMPTRMAVIWTDATYKEPGKDAIRGFGGRVYFYDDKNHAIAVEGELRVYAYNDSKRERTGSKPDRIFPFTPEDFAKHYSESDIGSSYSVWIPWDKAGGKTLEISLLPVFKSTGGNVIVGQQTLTLLPGKDEPEGLQVESPQSPVSQLLNRTSSQQQKRQYEGQQVSFDQVEPAGNKKMQVRTMTVEVPDSMQERMLKAAVKRNTEARERRKQQQQRLSKYGPPEFSAKSQGFPSNASTPNYADERSELKRAFEESGVIATGQQALPQNQSSWRAPQPWSPADPRANRFVRPRLQARVEPRQQQGSSPRPSQQFPSGSPFPPAMPLESANSQNGANSPVGW